MSDPSISELPIGRRLNSANYYQPNLPGVVPETWADSLCDNCERLCALLLLLAQLWQKTSKRGIVHLWRIQVLSKSAWRPKLLLAALTVVALISACNPGGAGPTPAERLTEVNLVIHGGPVTSTGHVEALNSVVVVRDSGGNLVRFDSSNIKATDGAFSELNVDPTEGIVRLYLSEGAAYSFHATAHDLSGNLVASADTESVVITASKNSWAIPLVSIMGAAQLVPRLPTLFVIPGQELDLTLSVTAAMRPDLRVPDRDYSREYAVTNGTAIAQASSRGLRLRVGNRADGDVEVVATVAGSVAMAGSFTDGDITVSLSLPFQTTLAVDTQPPTLSDLAYDPERQAFTGVSSDNMGVAMLTVWDGPVLLATTDLQDAVGSGLPEVIFPGGGTAFLTYIQLPAGDHALTVVSADYTGNESSLDLAVTVP